MARIIVGILLVLFAVVGVVMAEIHFDNAWLRANRQYVAASFAGAGVLIWWAGQRVARARENNLGRHESKPFLLFDLRYWGPLFLAVGVVTFFIHPLKIWQSRLPEAIAKPIEALRNKPPAPIKPEPIKKAVVFPPLRIQGVILRRNQAFAIIDGNSYAVGDQLGEVVIKAIDRTSVLLEMAGEVKLLNLN